MTSLVQTDPMTRLLLKMPSYASDEESTCRLRKLPFLNHVYLSSKNCCVPEGKIKACIVILENNPPLNIDDAEGEFFEEVKEFGPYVSRGELLLYVESDDFLGFTSRIPTNPIQRAQFLVHTLDVLYKSMAADPFFPATSGKFIHYLKNLLVEGAQSEIKALRVAIFFEIENESYLTNPSMHSLVIKLRYLTKGCWGRFLYLLKDCYNGNRTSLFSGVSSAALAATITSAVSLSFSPGNMAETARLVSSVAMGLSPVAYLGIKAYYKSL